MSDGISRSEAESIAAAAVRPVEIEVNQLSRRTAQIERQIQALEDEMARVAQALSQLGQNIQQGFRDLKHTSERGFSALEGSSEKIHRAQVAGTVATVDSLTQIQDVNKLGFGTLDGSVRQMSQALVQMEIIRQIHEVKAPVEQANRFNEEIEQRFTKAMESVYEVRRQFDALQERVQMDLEKKLRHIGSHIFRVLEEDFREYAEGPLSAPFDATLSLALEVDVDAIGRRAEALTTTLESFDEASLKPLLSAQSELEHMLASRYTIEGITGEVCYVPISVLEARVEGQRLLGIFADGRPEIVSHSDGSDTSINMSEVGMEVVERIRPLVESRFDDIPKRVLRDAEKTEIATALKMMADEGTLPRDLLPGYLMLLQVQSIEVFDEGEVR